jgi:hypothetical protein
MQALYAASSRLLFGFMSSYAISTHWFARSCRCCFTGGVGGLVGSGQVKRSRTWVVEVAGSGLWA